MAKLQLKNPSVWGTLCVALTYALWGTLSIFWNLLAEVSSLYIISQRILWSALLMLLFLALMGKCKELPSLFRNRRQLLLSALCGVLVTINWGVYIFAVTNGHVLDASLGYFIEPMMVGAIGLVCFRERPSRLEWLTFAFAFGGLVYLILRSGTVPILSVLIAGSFAIYGALKKGVATSPEITLFMETFCVLPLALVYMVWAEWNGQGSAGVLQGTQLILLPLCGVVTSIPLLLYNVGVRKIPYYISGILMYCNPTIQFFVGWLYFRESLDTNRLVAFCIIWVGMIFTLVEHGRKLRRQS